MYINDCGAFYFPMALIKTYKGTFYFVNIDNFLWHADVLLSFIYAQYGSMFLECIKHLSHRSYIVETDDMIKRADINWTC